MNRRNVLSVGRPRIGVRTGGSSSTVDEDSQSQSQSLSVPQSLSESDSLPSSQLVGVSSVVGISSESSESYIPCLVSIQWHNCTFYIVKIMGANMMLTWKSSPRQRKEIRFCNIKEWCLASNSTALMSWSNSQKYSLNTCRQSGDAATKHPNKHTIRAGFAYG